MSEDKVIRISPKKDRIVCYHLLGDGRFLLFSKWAVLELVHKNGSSYNIKVFSLHWIKFNLIKLTQVWSRQDSLRLTYMLPFPLLNPFLNKHGVPWCNVTSNTTKLTQRINLQAHIIFYGPSIIKFEFQFLR